MKACLGLLCLSACVLMVAAQGGQRQQAQGYAPDAAGGAGGAQGFQGQAGYPAGQLGGGQGMFGGAGLMSLLGGGRRGGGRGFNMGAAALFGGGMSDMLGDLGCVLAMRNPAMSSWCMMSLMN